MNSRARLLPAFAFALLPFSVARADGDEVATRLTRPTPAIDPDATGRLEMEREGRDDQEFEVEIDFVDTTSGTYTLWIESGPGTGIFLDAGPFEAEDEDEAKYERELDDEGEEGEEEELPLGVRDLRDLQDRAVEVRDPAGLAILFGSIPRFGGGSSSRDEKRTLPLLRPASEPIPSARGEVEAEIDDDESELEIETEGFDVTAQSFTVWIADAVGAMQEVGRLEPEDDDEDEGELDFGDDSGRPLPFGATDVSELGGRRVEVRNAQGVVVLEGSVPTLGGGGSPSTFRANQRLAAEGAGAGLRARGSAKARFQERQGRFDLRIDAKARTSDTQATLWMRDPGTQQMREVASGTWVGRNAKRLRWEWRSERSQPLPLGVTDPRALFGREIEVRAQSGAVILRGRL